MMHNSFDVWGLKCVLEWLDDTVTDHVLYCIILYVPSCSAVRCNIAVSRKVVWLISPSVAWDIVPCSDLANMHSVRRWRVVVCILWLSDSDRVSVSSETKWQGTLGCHQRCSTCCSRTTCFTAPCDTATSLLRWNLNTHTHIQVCTAVLFTAIGSLCKMPGAFSITKRCRNVFCCGNHETWKNMPTTRKSFWCTKSGDRDRMPL